MILILFFTLILNVVAIALTYYCLSNLEKKEKVMFIAVGIAITYILTTVAYWFSTKDIAIKEVSEIGKNLITFLFVPINGIVVLPILAKSYNKYKIGTLALAPLRNRIILLAIILFIILLVECSYFKDIQNNVVTLIEKSNEKKNETTQNIGNNDLINSTNTENANEILNMININDTNEISNITENIVNQVD